MKETEKDYKAMYDEIVQSEWFKTAYENGSLYTPEISEDELKAIIKPLTYIDWNVADEEYADNRLASITKNILSVTKGVKPITKGDIKQAASEYEKIACCEKDHPWLKEYVNEDFEAGAEWAIKMGKITTYILELVKNIRNDSELGSEVRKYVNKQTS